MKQFGPNVITRFAITRVHEPHEQAEPSILWRRKRYFLSDGRLIKTSVGKHLWVRYVAK